MIFQLEQDIQFIWGKKVDVNEFMKMASWKSQHLSNQNGKACKKYYNDTIDEFGKVQTELLQKVQ